LQLIRRTQYEHSGLKKPQLVATFFVKIKRVFKLNFLSIVNPTVGTG